MILTSLESRRLSYKCRLCEKENISKKKQLHAHLSECHSDCMPKFYCVPCEQEYKSINEFTLHMNKEDHLKNVKNYNDNFLII